MSMKKRSTYMHKERFSPEVRDTSVPKERGPVEFETPLGQMHPGIFQGRTIRKPQGQQSGRASRRGQNSVGLRAGPRCRRQSATLAQEPACILGSLKAARSGTLRARQGGEHFETRPELRWAKGGPLVPPPECHADPNASSALKLETPSTRPPHILRIKEVTGPPHIGSDWPDQSLPEAPAPPFTKKEGEGE